MSQHYSTKLFFRRVPNELLQRYFHSKSLLLNLKIADLKETKIDPLFDAWLKLPERQRNVMDAEFRTIWEMSCRKGFIAIRDEAEFHWREKPDTFTAFNEQISALKGDYHRAMISYLEYPEIWPGAVRFYQADSLSFWRKRKNMGNLPAHVDKESIKEFERMLQHYFYRMEGRGENCVVEVFRRGTLDYFFAYPEDHAQQSLEWVNGEFENRPHNPAFQIVFVYSQDDATLDLNFRGDIRTSDALQEMFSIAILKQDKLPPNPDDNRIYDLEPLRNRHFKFVYDDEMGIEKVFVKKIRLTSKLVKRQRITLEADDDKALYDQLERMQQAISLQHYRMDMVELKAEVIVPFQPKLKKVTIRIACPCSCSLKYDEHELKLRQMLKLSGIEPVEQSDDE